VSRVADQVESVQLGMAADLLADPAVTAPQLRFLAARMAEALRDVHRIAESRGARLPVADAAGEEVVCFGDTSRDSGASGEIEAER
jgi:hypothetical protein